MDNKYTKLTAFVLASFGFVSGVAQTLSLAKSYVIATFSTTALCAGMGLYLYHSSRKGSDVALKHLSKVLPRQNESDLTVRYISDFLELKEVLALGVEAYGEANTPDNAVMAWWHSYPRGAIALFEGSECIGGIGLWPLRKKPFFDLLNGRRKEEDLGRGSIDTDANKRFWYIGGIFLVKKVRKTEAIKLLVGQGLDLWLSDEKIASTIDLAALAISKEGEAMLKRFGFHICKKKSETVHHYSVFVRKNVSVNQLKEELKPFVK